MAFVDGQRTAVREVALVRLYEEWVGGVGAAFLRTFALPFEECTRLKVLLRGFGQVAREVGLRICTEELAMDFFVEGV